MKYYQPKEILIEKSALEYPKTGEILEKFDHVPRQIVDDYDWRQDSRFDGARDPLTKGKKRLYLKVFKGAPVKLCPGFTANAVCCNYHIVDFVENCPSECVYCILQSIQNRPLMTVHVNADEMIGHIARMITARPGTKFRIGTGEFSDSLSMDHVVNVNRRLVETFANLPNALLELKTKSDMVSPLLDLKHNGNTVVSWSIGTEYAGKHIEFNTASPKQRILAAASVAQKGYPVAFHFDPIILQDDAAERYEVIIKYLAAHVPQASVGWFSMGSLRFMPKLQTVAESRFPGTDIFTSEFIESDGKKRYFRPLREKLYRTVRTLLTDYFPDVPVYMCMETESLWQSLIGDVPANPTQTENRITSRFAIGGCAGNSKPGNAVA